MTTSNHYCVKFSPMQGRFQSPRNPQHSECACAAHISHAHARVHVGGCALFGNTMLARLSPAFQLFGLRWVVAGPTQTVRSLSRTCIACGSDDRKGGHSKASPMAKLEHSFQLLGINKHDCTVEQIRESYIELVKRYHPDSRTPHASAEKFTEVCPGLVHLIPMY